jgi:P-type Mg2+ transporter
MSDLNVQERRSIQLPVAGAACLSPEQVLEQLTSTPAGLTNNEASARLEQLGPNAVRTHRANGWAVLGRQFASPILILLIVTAGLSLVLGDATNSIVIGVILLVSVGLGFTNEFRAERASEALHSKVTHRATVLRDGTAQDVDVPAWCPATS